MIPAWRKVHPVATKYLRINQNMVWQRVWLEKGNSYAGLEHIMQRHAKDFEEKYNISKKDIPDFLYRVVTNGQVVSNKIKIIKDHKNYERIYKYQDQYYVLAGIGDNGFLVSAYPINVKGSN